MPHWVTIAVIIAAMMQCSFSGHREKQMVDSGEYEQRHAVQRNRCTLPETASHREKSYDTGLFFLHKTPFVIQGRYGFLCNILFLLYQNITRWIR